MIQILKIQRLTMNMKRSEEITGSHTSKSPLPLFRSSSFDIREYLLPSHQWQLERQVATGEYAEKLYRPFLH